MTKIDVHVGDFIQFTFGETHGILTGRTEYGEVVERTGDLLVVQTGSTKCVVFLEEVDKKVTDNDEKPVNTSANLVN